MRTAFPFAHSSRFALQVNIFMTHMSNYGGDRLGLYLFDAAFRFLRCWTNLKLEVHHPLQLATKYFEIFPGDKDPVWSSPEDDPRHQMIWPVNKTFAFPKVVVIGPQKTGEWITSLSPLTPEIPCVASFINKFCHQVTSQCHY